MLRGVAKRQMRNCSGNETGTIVEFYRLNESPDVNCSEYLINGVNKRELQFRGD